MKRPAFADLPLRVKGLILVAVPLAAFLLVATTLLLVEFQQQQAERWVRHTFEVRSSLQTLLALMGDAESAVRGYLLTRDQAVLAPYYQSVREFPPAARRLVELTADNPTQLADARRIQEAGRQRLDSLTRLVNVFQQGRGPVELRAAIAHSRKSMDAVRAELAGMHREEERLLALREAEARHARVLVYLFLAATAIIGVCGALLSHRMLGLGVLRRVDLLQQRARLLAERRPFPDDRLGGDEIGKLGEALTYADRLLNEREGRLREAEQFLQHLIETSPAVIFRQDPSTMRVTYVSPNSERILGYTAAEILERPHFWMDHIHPDDRERVLAEDREALARRASHLETEYRLRHKSGEYRWLRGFVYLEYAPDGTPMAMVGHRLDVTERKQAEAELMEREATLNAANRELEAFSYSVSHDLRAPLRAVDGFSRIVLEDYAAQLDAEGKYYLERMRRATQHMGALIDDILKLSRISRVQMRRETVDLSAMTRSIADGFMEAEPQRKVEFVIQPGVTAAGDPGLLRVVLENLLGNAWKFTSHHATARIEFGASQRDGRTTYFVRDDGAGFDPAYARKLFSAFQRLHSTSEFPGTGIGLATVQRIVRRHGGSLSAVGAVEQGATFCFTLHSLPEDERARLTPTAGGDPPPS